MRKKEYMRKNDTDAGGNVRAGGHTAVSASASESSEENILEIGNLSVSFDSPDGEIEAVRSVSLSLRSGEILALVGESGCGKSVLCRTVMKLIPKNAYIKGGSVVAAGTDITHCSPRDMRKLRGPMFSMIFQNPMTALNPAMTVGKQIGEAIRVHDRKAASGEIRDRVIRLMERTGIEDPGMRSRLFPHQLSGGMRQRAAIAVALAPAPRILFADEPTTALDAAVRNRILGLLCDIREKQKTSVILVTHDLNDAFRTADRIAVMYAGKIVETGTAEEILRDPRHPYTRALMRCTPSLNSGGDLYTIPGTPPSLIHPPQGDSFAPRNEYALAIDFKKEPPMFAVSETHRAATWLLDPRAPETVPPLLRDGISLSRVRPSSGDAALQAGTLPKETKSAGIRTEEDPLIDIRSVTLRFPVSRTVSVTALDGVTLQIRRGEIFGLVGESGSGKSTLARCILNILRPDSGQTIYDHIDTCDPKQYSAAKKMLQTRRSLIFQDSDASLSPKMTAGQIITEPLCFRRPRLSPAKRRAEAKLQAEAAGLDSIYLSRFPSDLSGGQRQRTAIARALVTGPEFLAADEPTASLDVSVQAQIVNLFRRLQRERGFTLLFITHDLALVRCLCDRTGVMHRGRRVETASTQEIFENPQHPYTRSLLAAASPDPFRERELKSAGR